MSAEASGFKKFVRENLVLSVGDAIDVDIALEVGALTEQLTVTSESPLLETVKADRGTLVDQQSVKELPLNGRNPFMLAKIVAGVNFNGTVIYQRPFDNGAIAQWTINGGLYESNEFLLDGAPNNAEAGTNNIAYVPPVDAVQEFKIQTNSYDAQYGHTSGGIVNVSLKSGTNTPHGTVYEFARRKAWDANSFQNNAAGAAQRRTLSGSVRRPARRPGLHPQGLRWPQQDLLPVHIREVPREYAAALYSLRSRAGIRQRRFLQTGERRRPTDHHLRSVHRPDREWQLYQAAVPQ